MNDLSEEQTELLYHYIFTGHSLNDVDWLSARSSLFPDVLRAIINSYGISRTQTNILQNIMDGLDLSEYVGNTFTDWSSYENINEEEKESSCLSPSSLSCQKYITLTRELYDKNNKKFDGIRIASRRRSNISPIRGMVYRPGKGTRQFD